MRILHYRNSQLKYKQPRLQVFLRAWYTGTLLYQSPIDHKPIRLYIQLDHSLDSI